MYTRDLPGFDDPHSPIQIVSDKPTVHSDFRRLSSMGLSQNFETNAREYVDPFELPMDTLTDADLGTEREMMIRNREERQSLCIPADFNDKDASVRYYKALMVNLYMEYGGNWAKVFKDHRSVSRRTMASYWADEKVRIKVAALDPILEMEAKGIVVEVFKEGIDEKARLAAALRFLEFRDATGWDRGIRKQIVANKGSIANTLISRKVTDEEFLATLVKDRLNKLPEEARVAIAQALETRQLPEPIPVQGEVVPTAGFGTVTDMSKLVDPFEKD